MTHVHYIERKGRGFHIVTDGATNPDDIIAEMNAGLFAHVGGVRNLVTLVDPNDAAAWAAATNPVAKWMMRDVDETGVAALLRGVAEWCGRMLYRR